MRFRFYGSVVGIAASLLLLSPLVLMVHSTAVAVAAPQDGAAEIVETIIPLRYLAPADAITLLKTAHRPGSKPEKVASLPEGIRSLTPDNDKNALRVAGTIAGIKSLTGLLPLLDVAPRQVLLKARVVAVDFGPDGSVREKVAQAPIISTTNNHQASTQVEQKDQNGVVTSAVSLAVTPRLSETGDSVTLITRFGTVWPDRASDGLERAVTLPAGRRQRIAGLTQVKDKRVREVISLGRMPERWSGAFRVLYLEVEAAEVKEAEGKAGSP